MKTGHSNNKKNGSRRPPPILFGVFTSEKELTKENSLTFKLQSNLTDSESMIYESTVPVFNTGPVYKLIHFQEELNKIFVGQNVTTGPAKFAMTRRLLKGEALQALKPTQPMSSACNDCSYRSFLNELYKRRSAT